MELRKKGFLKFTFLFIVLLCLMVAWLGFGEHGFLHLYRMEQERVAHMEKINRLEQENRELLEDIQRLRTDHAYIESMGRRELGLVKNDEILYRFDKDSRAPAPGSVKSQDKR